MKVITKILWGVLLLNLSACSILTSAPKKPTPPEIKITMPEPNRLEFRGKGAGAGMMLMSSMGPMGIAVGVAIDEGIRKDIEQQLVNSGYDFEVQFRGAIENALKQSTQDIESLDITIAKYGFKTHSVPDVSDAIVAELNVKVMVSPDENIEISYPGDFSEDLFGLPLDIAKQDPELSSQALAQAIEFVANRISAELIAQD